MAVSLKTDLRFPESGQHGHGSRIIHPWMWKQMRNWKRSFLLGFAGSLLIETLQMLTGRGLFQLDDLITNAAGMMAGYGIYQIAKKLWKRVYKSRFQ